MTMEKSEAISIQTSDRNFRNYSEKPLKNTSIAKNTKFLVGSLYSEKPPNAYALMDVMKRAWRASGGIDMREWSNNLFMVRFEEEKKMRWVIENQPWHFENSLFLIRQLEPMEQPSKILLREAQIWVRFYDAPLSFMTERMAEQIAGKVGRFIRVDSSHDLFGRYMRVKVGINVSKKLVNRINVKVEGIDFEIGIKYEALPTYCYYCGTIGHTFKYCEMMNHHDVEEDPENFPFGPAIKASPSKRAKSSISPTFQVKDQRPKPKQSILQTPSENKESISFVAKEQGNPIEIGKDWKRIPVHFRALERPKEDEFCLELAKNHTYDDVVDRVAQKLGLDDPSKIRLTPHNCYSQQPKPNPIKYRSVDHLLDMLVHYNQISDILYYEILDIPLPELQCLKTLKVAFHHATRDEAAILNIRLLKQSTVGDVLNEIKTKVELSHPDAELRLLEVFYHKIYKIFPIHEKIENINDQYWTLRAEEIPEEEKNLGPNDRLIHVYHFTKEIAQNQVQVQNFGDPFFLVIHEGESLADVKLRIQKKLQVPDEEFFKWKFAFLSLGRPEYLEDSDIISSRFQRRDVYGAWEQYLGLEHSGSTPKKAYTVNQNRHTFEKPVKIYN